MEFAGDYLAGCVPDRDARMTYTNQGLRVLNATSADEPLLEMIEITHPDLAIPARFVNDTIDLVSNGNTFFATSFRLARPDDVDQQTPTAKLSVDNIGRELTQWLEVSNGGKGARCRILAVLRSDPNTYQFDMTLDLSGISITNMEVASTLGFQHTLMQPAVAVRYDPFSAPGSF